jgi:hypothetical protein
MLPICTFKDQIIHVRHMDELIDHTYFGHWNRQLFEGYGFRISKPYGVEDYSIYEGIFVNNQINGVGRVIEKDLVYSGGFKDDKIHGYGHFEDKIYKALGEFENDSLNGFGVLETDGKAYCG